jgi:hypothetical protein
VVPALQARGVPVPEGSGLMPRVIELCSTWIRFDRVTVEPEQEDAIRHGTLPAAVFAQLTECVGVVTEFEVVQPAEAVLIDP